MSLTLLSILCSVPPPAECAGAESLPDIDITVEDTWLIDYAAEVNGMCFDWSQQLLIFRSDLDGKLFLADPADCSCQDSIDLPQGVLGFGVAHDSWGTGEYYINDQISGQIFHSDGSDSWASFPDPAGSAGMGMDSGWYPGYIYEISGGEPHELHGMKTDGTDHSVYSVPGVSGEVSGFMGNEFATLGPQPSGIILTTRYGRDFYFLWIYGDSDYVMYGQEPCPLAVEESLGLTWSPDFRVYWSWLGTDGEYYISRLMIPVFGGIGEGTGTGPGSPMGTLCNPAAGSASISVSMTKGGNASLQVYDISGRLLEELHGGFLEEGETVFTFSAPPGVYAAVLGTPSGSWEHRFVLTE